MSYRFSSETIKTSQRISMSGQLLAWYRVYLGSLPNTAYGSTAVRSNWWALLGAVPKAKPNSILIDICDYSDLAVKIKL